MKDKTRQEYLDKVVKILEEASGIVSTNPEDSKKYIRALKLFERNQDLRNKLNMPFCELDTQAASNAINKAMKTLENIKKDSDDADLGLEDKPEELDRNSIAGRMIDALEEALKNVSGAHSLAIQAYPHLIKMPCLQGVKGLEIAFGPLMREIANDLGKLV